MAKKKTHSELLGYCYIMFQTTFSNYVKCWIDGSENYTYLTLEKFYELFDTSKSPINLKAKAKKCLNTTSIYFWDVDNEIIKRLELQREETSDIGERILTLNPFNKKKLGFVF